MSTQDKSASSKYSQKSSFWRRIDIRFPWLKLFATLVIGPIAIMDLCDLTISKTGEWIPLSTVAPMQKHARVTRRDLKGKKLVVLTFDDGPSNATTPKLLDILYKREVPATFFMLGNLAKNNPDLVREVESKGNEVASHTMYHQNLTSISLNSAKADIEEARATIRDILGHNPSYTRPPYGNHNDKIRSIMATPVILWSVDTLDWKNKNADQIVSTALSQIHDGAIILMHDIHPTTVESVPKLIDEIRKAGYEFATLKELSENRKTILQPGSFYYNLRP